MHKKSLKQTKLVIHRDYSLMATRFFSALIWTFFFKESVAEEVLLEVVHEKRCSKNNEDLFRVFILFLIKQMFLFITFSLKK